MKPPAFLPSPPLPHNTTTTTTTNLHIPRLSHTATNHAPPTLSRRRLISTAASLSLTTIIPSAPQSSASPLETDTVFMDISLAGQPIGRIIIALYGQEAPDTVDTFKKLAQGTLRNRAGKTAGFRYSQAAKVVKGRLVQLGRVKQIDYLNQQPGTAQRQVVGVEVPQNHDDNQLHHDAPGLVSVRRGGSFEFAVMLAADRSMDDENIVVGRVVDGMDVVDRLGNVPMNKKTIRDGYRSIGKVIGDARAKVDLENKPLQKIQITNCGIL